MGDPILFFPFEKENHPTIRGGADREINFALDIQRKSPRTALLEYVSPAGEEAAAAALLVVLVSSSIHMHDRPRALSSEAKMTGPHPTQGSRCTKV